MTSSLTPLGGVMIGNGEEPPAKVMSEVRSCKSHQGTAAPRPPRRLKNARVEDVLSASLLLRENTQADMGDVFNVKAFTQLQATPDGFLASQDASEEMTRSSSSVLSRKESNSDASNQQSQMQQQQQQQNESLPPKVLNGWADILAGCKCLSTKTSPKWILFCLCWATAVQGMVVNGFVNVCITTIEKRYHLRSADAGLIAVAYDVASVLCSVPVSYLGSLPGANKPRWLAWGMFVMAIGSFVFAFPHFVSPPYKDATTVVDGSEELFLCLSQRNVSGHCAKTAEVWLSSFRHVFALGQFLHGVGASPLYTLGITYLDESVPVRSSSLYLGVFYAMAIVGPACGYVLGGQLLNIYVDSPSVSVSKLGMYSTSDQWLGAWWIGFLFSGTLTVVIACAIMTFPKNIIGQKSSCSQRLSDPNAAVSHISAHSFRKIKDLPKAAKVLALNYTFVCLSLAGATEGVLLTGFATFMPKFIESQFSISASSAALLVGMVAVPAGGGGTLFGGWIIKHFYLQCTGILKLCMCLSVICFISCLSFVISCPDPSFAGVTVNYINDSLSPYQTELISGCNLNCGCQNVPFDPVCGTDHILYFSPCHAGCSSVRIVNERKIFDDCKCIGSPLKSELESFPEIVSDSSAFLQKCPSSCSLMGVFLTIFFVIMTITFILSLPAVTGTLRSVPDSHRSLALGLQWMFVRILGTIPGPILFGLIIDSTCRLWQNTCNVVGACRNYDNLRMSRSMMAISLVFKSLSTMFFILAWWFFTPPSREEEHSEGVSLDDTVASSSTTTSTPVTNDNPTFG